MKRIFGSIIEVRKGEIGVTLLMLASYYLILVTYYLLKPARDSLFLVKVSPELLPLVFVITALVTAPVVTLYSRASRSLKLNWLINVTIAVIIVNLVILRVLIQINESWVYYLFYTWVSIYGALTTSQFWLLANAVFDASQAKRVFTLLGLGGIVGAFTGGEVTSFFVKTAGVATEDLLFFCIGCLAVCALLVTVIWSKKSEEITESDRRRSRSKDAAGKLGRVYKTVFRSRHLLLIVGIVAMTMMVASFVDYQFKKVSFEAFQTKADLTAFLGKFYGRLSLASLILQLLFANRLIRWLGVGGIILFLPIALLAGSAAMFVVPGLTAAVLLRGADGTLKYSLDKTGRELLFLPIPLAIKKKVKIFIDLFIDRWFRGLAGGLLLLCTLVLKMEIRQLSLVVAGLLLVWLVLVLLMRKEYVNSFRRAIEKREIDSSDITVHINDQVTVNALILSLGSTNERQIVYALEMLKSVKDVELVWPLLPLLRHKSPEVRRKTLEAMHIHGDESQIDEIKSLLKDPDITVRGEAIHFICTHSARGLVEDVEEYLHNADLRIKYACIACIAEHQYEAAQRLITTEVAESILADESPHALEGRTQLARALGSAASEVSRQYLPRLLQDRSTTVVREAIASVGRLRDRTYLPWLLERLADKTYRAHARAALSDFGTGIVGTLNDYLNDRSIGSVIRQNIPRVLSQIPDQQTVDTLVKSLQTVEPSLKYHLVKALNRLRAHYEDLRFETAELESALVKETRTYYELLQVLQSQAKALSDDATDLLKRALAEKLQQNLERIFRLLGLVYPPKDIYNAYQGVVSKEKTFRSNAVEFLDNLIRGDLKKLVLPLLDDVPVDNVLRKGEELFRLTRLNEEESIEFLIRGRDSWLRACALYRCDSLSSEKLGKLVLEAASDQDPIVSETARLVLERKAGRSKLT